MTYTHPVGEVCCGVEIEVFAPRPGRVAAALPESWQYDHNDVEAISPIFETMEEARRGITAACKALRDIGCEAWDIKGLHVHLSRAHLGEVRCGRLMLRYYEELPRFNERWPHRRRELFDDCTLPVTGEACEHCRPACAPHRELDTIEVRQHPSTLDPDVILAWITELYALATIDRSEATELVVDSWLSSGQAIVEGRLSLGRPSH